MNLSRLAEEEGGEEDYLVQQMGGLSWTGPLFDYIIDELQQVHAMHRQAGAGPPKGTWVGQSIRVTCGTANAPDTCMPQDWPPHLGRRQRHERFGELSLKLGEDRRTEALWATAHDAGDHTAAGVTPLPHLINCCRPTRQARLGLLHQPSDANPTDDTPPSAASQSLQRMALVASNYWRQIYESGVHRCQPEPVQMTKGIAPRQGNEVLLMYIALKSAVSPGCQEARLCCTCHVHD